MLVLGLTGPTGAGKGAVADILSAQGFLHIDGDVLSRTVTRPGKPCLAALIEAFGGDILTADGTLDRKRLGKLAFSHPQSLAWLNAVIHPYIEREVCALLAQYESKGRRGALIDGAALYESGLCRLCSAVVCVTAPRDIRLARIMARDGLTKEEALRRMDAQPGESHYRAGADFVLTNGGDFDALKKSVAELVKRLEEEYNNE